MHIHRLHSRTKGTGVDFLIRRDAHVARGCFLRYESHGSSLLRAFVCLYPPDKSIEKELQQAGQKFKDVGIWLNTGRGISSALLIDDQGG